MTEEKKKRSTKKRPVKEHRRNYTTKNAGALFYRYLRAPFFPHNQFDFRFLIMPG